METTPPLRKFMFDRSFDSAGNAAPVRRGPVTLKPEQVDALKKEAFDAGYAAGQKAGADAGMQTEITLLTRIDQKIAEMIQNMDALRQENDTQLRAGILTIARKILPGLTKREGLQEIQSMLTDVITEMVHEPRLVVRINESQFDAINTKIHEITVQKAYAGKVVVLADDDIAVGDCRVEWADGGIERNTKDTWQAVEQTVAPNDILTP